MRKHGLTGQVLKGFVLACRASGYKNAFLVLLMLFCFESTADAQDIYYGEKGVKEFLYDEFQVSVSVAGCKPFEMDVIYTEDSILYISIEELFKTLKIPCNVSQQGDVLTGFIENEEKKYEVNFQTKTVSISGKVVDVSGTIIKENGFLFMAGSAFSETFGLKLSFNFRALALRLDPTFELPAIKQERIESLRTRLGKLYGEIEVDTIIRRNYHLFRPGVFDWSFNSFQSTQNNNGNRLGLSVGSELLFGEAMFSVLLYDYQKFNPHQIQYLWQWVDNDKALIKQAQFGKIFTQSISFISAPVIGGSIRNTPSSVRKAKGFYTISDYTEPNWTVELYLNNILVSLTKADASGLYIFKVPILYGFTTVKLKFYGPQGEERSEERSINVPYTIMPKNEFEYGITAGIVQDNNKAGFGKAEFKYGLSNYFTIGVGWEYLSSITNGRNIPFAKFTFQPFSRLTLTGEYDHNVRVRGLINIYLFDKALLEINYSKYKKGQLATRFNASEERKFRFSLPWRAKLINGLIKVDFSQLLYENFTFHQGYFTLSGYYKQFSVNSSTQINWTDAQSIYSTTDLSFSCRLKNDFIIRPSAKYNFNNEILMSFKIEFEKRIKKSSVNAYYEKNTIINGNYFSVSYKIDLPFARAGISCASGPENTIFLENASGSIAFDEENGYLYKSQNTSTGRGGLAIYPFLDRNQNGVFDADEHLVKLSKIKISGGRTLWNDKDSIIRIPDLIAFNAYNLTFDDNDLENISWWFPKKHYQVVVDPHQFKRVDIPVISVGEVSGMVFLEREDGLKGIGRIKILLAKNDKAKTRYEVLSESDGYFVFLGLPPGQYTAAIDSSQLTNLDFSVTPALFSFIIHASEDGDVVEDINFKLTMNKKPEPHLHQKEQLPNYPKIIEKNKN